MTESYTPRPGDQVRVRRYQVPTPELPGTAERKLAIEVAGTVTEVRGHVLHLDPAALDIRVYAGDGRPLAAEYSAHSLDYTFLGQDPGHGCSWTLQTEVVRLADVAAHDQAEHAERVAAGEAQVARALALWERARDAEVVARQRLTGAQERLEAILRDKP